MEGIKTGVGRGGNRRAKKKAGQKLGHADPLKITAPGLHNDGNGLYLSVGSSGNKAWVFRYRQAGRLREMGLGAFNEDDNDLERAREERDRWARVLRAGRDPIDERKRRQDEARTGTASRPTFGTCATDYIAAHTASWRNPKHRQQWENTLATHCASIWNQPVDEIDTESVLRVLRPIWQRLPETASRLRGRIERVLSAAKVRGFRNGENPARWRDHLKELLGNPAKLIRAKSKGHHPALPWQRVPAFMAALAKIDSTPARALALAIRTAKRTTEVRSLPWPELDLKARTWTIPGVRMKMDREHIEPLTAPELAILAEMEALRGDPKGPNYVFPGRNGGRPISDMSMLALMRRMHATEIEAGRPGWLDPKTGRTAVVHGFRSTFRDWVAEATNFDKDLAEMTLAHKVGDATEEAYARSALVEKRRALMEAWNAFLDGGAGADVIELRRPIAESASG